jgi:hypothetical protein
MKPAEVIAMIALAGVGWWAFGPVHPPIIEHADPAALAPTTPTLTIASLDVAAFRAPLWVAPPAPVAPPPPAAPPPPLKLQLLAVVHEGEVFKAMLYDPDSDKILVVAEGEALGTGEAGGGSKVERVTAAGVQIRDGTGLRTLALRPDQGGAP